MTLFDDWLEAHARRTDPWTSHEAAASVKVRESQKLVLSLLRQGPATDEELADRAHAASAAISPSGLRTRRCELVVLGLAVDTGERRRTAAGRQTIVWAAV